MKRLFPVICVFSSLFSVGSFAGSATWKTNPTSDWNTPSNWMPATVPNSPNDTATFPGTNTPTVVVNSSVAVNALVFANDSLSQYTIMAGDSAGLHVATLTLSGDGVIDDSSEFAPQKIGAGATLASNGARNLLSFQNNANAGISKDLIIAYGGQSSGFFGGAVEFRNSSSLASAAVVSDPGLSGGSGGQVTFADSSSAGVGIIYNGGYKDGSSPGVTIFLDNSTAGAATIFSSGSLDGIDPGGQTFFRDSSTAGTATIVADPATFDGVNGGAMVYFTDSSSAGAAILIPEPGSNSGDSGAFYFEGNSSGGTAQVWGAGNLVIENHNPPGVTIGSLEDFSTVTLGANTLTVGSNNLSTSYSGTIQGSGGLAKIGTGLLTLATGNTYSGGTTINAGSVRTGNTVGSATGTGPVNLNAGNLGGQGTIAGPVTVGSGTGPGAILEPGVGSSGPRKLTLQNSLTFKADGDYACQLNTKRGRADQVIANGVTIESGAQYAFGLVGNKPLSVGKVFTVISNTSTSPISGTFANLADGSTLTEGKNRYLVSYSGGDGNDLTLTVVQ